MEPAWYTITQEMSLESASEKHDITLIVPKFKEMLKTKAIKLRHCRMKCSIFQVPNSQFRLKLILVGSKKKLIQIYYMTTKSIFMRSLKIYCDDTVIEYHKFFCKCKVQANKWHHCAVLNDLDTIDYDELDLSFIFTISREDKVELEVPPTQLGDDFGILLTDGSYSDVTIKSAEGVEFKVHKGILAIRSAVLKAHFDHNMRESTTNIVETTWETEVLRDVLIFVYTGTAPRVDNDPVKLLAAADYYQLQGLKAHCEKALYKRLTVENAIETLGLAEQYSAKTLLNDTLAFIKDGRVRLIINTEGWSKIQSTSILKKLYEVITADEYDNTTNIFEQAYKELSVAQIGNPS